VPVNFLRKQVNGAVEGLAALCRSARRGAAQHCHQLAPFPRRKATRSLVHPLAFDHPANDVETGGRDRCRSHSVFEKGGVGHPECPPEVIAECDFAGSTAAMADFVGRKRPPRDVLLTECSMSDNVALQYPQLEFVRPCNLCPHMKRITLPKIRRALETMTREVTVDHEIAERARRSVERMMALG
jgi:Quinolinate synthetase A protein